MESTQKTAVIIGAGPAGLTAAIELLRHTDIKPIVIEASTYVGGISKTVRFNDNRMDIGGHRFFSKSDAVLDWWLEMLPLAETDAGVEIGYQNKRRTLPVRSVADAESSDDVMLVRRRKSRILYGGKFFDYPITLSVRTLANLGPVKIAKIGISYVKARLFPIRKEKSLEDFFINRFGRELYETFFKSYTEKVWGKPCHEIGADWGRQRIKGLSVSKAIGDAVSRIFRKRTLDQKDVETSLIEYFLYPKYGPGHMWETVADKVRAMGGEIRTEQLVCGIGLSGGAAASVTAENVRTSERDTLAADYVFSTMPIDRLFDGMQGDVPQDVANIAKALEFRHFITVGVLVDSADLRDESDNWIYIHEPGVHVGRVQFFHNWSEAMVGSSTDCLVGLEYFCEEGDALWNMPRAEFEDLARAELVKIGLLSDSQAIKDLHIERVEKAYPVYAGAYDRFDDVRRYLDSIPNLYPIGRNGMHRYNNQDHSMLTAMAAVQSILGSYEKSDIWNINADQEYHEAK